MLEIIDFAAQYCSNGLIFSMHRYTKNRLRHGLVMG